jgi:hypothetical protein
LAIRLSSMLPCLLAITTGVVRTGAGDDRTKSLETEKMESSANSDDETGEWKGNQMPKVVYYARIVKMRGVRGVGLSIAIRIRSRHN